MSGLFEFLATVTEGVATLLFVVAACFALIYYASTFVEERLKSVVTLLKGLAIVVDVLLLIFVFAGFGFWATLLVVLSNGLWTFLLFTGFPFISFTRPDFLLAVVSSVFAHFFMTLHFLESDDGTFITCSYFLLFVWAVPVGMILSLSAVEGPDGSSPAPEGKGPLQPKSAWRDIFKRMIKKAEDVLPHAGAKFD